MKQTNKTVTRYHQLFFCSAKLNLHLPVERNLWLHENPCVCSNFDVLNCTVGNLLVDFFSFVVFPFLLKIQISHPYPVCLTRVVFVLHFDCGLALKEAITAG